MSSVEYHKNRIHACLGQPEYKGAQGIIIVVGMFGAPGTVVDCNNVQSTFKELGFAVLSVQDPTSESLANLMKAAGEVEYPNLKKFRFFAFYFAGHGGADVDGNDDLTQADLFIQTASEVEGGPTPILYIEPYIIKPMKDLNTALYRIFLFDCCQSPGAGQAYRSTSTGAERGKGKKVEKRDGQVVAYAVSKGQVSVGNKDEGGVWTHHLCNNIKQAGKPLVLVFAETNEDLRKSGSYQVPLTISTLDMVKIIKEPTHKDQSTSSASDGGTSGTGSEPPPAVPEPSPSTFDEDAVFGYLEGKSSHWEAIGRSFKVPLNDRDGLRRDIGLTNGGRLEKVIDIWFTTTGSAADLTWVGFISLLEKKMKFNDVARKVEADLKSGTIV